MRRFFPQWITRLSNTGIDSNLSAADAGRVKMCNIFNVFAIGGFMLFICIFSFYQWWLIIFFQLVFIVLFSVSILLNRIKKYNLSRLLFLFTFCCFILIFSWLDYRHNIGVYYYLFVLPLMIFVLFDAQQYVSVIGSLCGVILTYVLIREVKFPFNLNKSDISINDERLMHILNVMIIFFVISFIAYHFARMYHKMNVSLKIKQRQLAHNHSLAKAGNWYYSLRFNIFRYGDELKDIFGLDQENKKMEAAFFIDCLSRDDRKRFIRNCRSAIKYQTSAEEDYEINLHNGTKKYVVAVILPVTKYDHKVRGLQGVCIDVTEERKTLLYLQEHLSEKEILLDEIHNRIAYNLSLITGFVRLQILNTADHYVKEMLDVCRQRIDVMSLIHKKMFTTSFNATLFDDYLNDLIESIKKNIVNPRLQINVVKNLEPTLLAYNNVLPCGLIINELMTNSFKHAFEGRSKGNISISMHSLDDNIIISYSDDGIGYDENYENSGIGMDLIQSLTLQLKGTIKFINQNGFNCTLMFKAVKN